MNAIPTNLSMTFTSDSDLRGFVESLKTLHDTTLKSALDTITSCTEERDATIELMRMNAVDMYLSAAINNLRQSGYTDEGTELLHFVASSNTVAIVEAIIERFRPSA